MPDVTAHENTRHNSLNVHCLEMVIKLDYNICLGAVLCLGNNYFNYCMASKLIRQGDREREKSEFFLTLLPVFP